MRLPERVLALVGAVVGIVAFLFRRDARASVLRNLRVVCPELSETARRRLAARVFAHGAWSNLELLALSPRALDALPDEVSVDGWKNLETALARGRGVIMITGHVGTPSTAGQLLGRRGFPTTVIVEPLTPPELFRLMVEIREQAGLRMVPTGPRAVRDIVSALRRNEIVGIFVDRDVAGTGQMLPFFGREARVSTAAATLALRTGASVVPCVAYRTRPFHAVAEIGPPIELVRSGDAQRDASEGTLQILARVEGYIRRRPEQWVVFTDIWPDASSTMAQSRR